LRPSVVHVYGVLPAGGAPDLSVVGIDGSKVRTLDLHGLAMVVSDLDRLRFGHDEWAAHGQEIEWLRPVAAAHHGVLQHVVMQGADVLPLRLPAIYEDDEALAVAVAASLDRIREVLESITGKVEWSVHAFALEGGGLARETRAASGSDYIQRRKSDLAAREESAQRRRDAVARVHDELEARSAGGVVKPPQDRVLSGRPEQMVLNAAYLVARSEERAFLARADELGREVATRGVAVETSGPWPPYSFVTLGSELHEDGKGPGLARHLREPERS
jgi:Gas vesicle synthesis protein GvpL/GvpF